jgi:hypothetical protein
MISFVIYDEAGVILQAGAVPEALLEDQAGEGRFVLAGEGHWDTHYVVDGQLAERPVMPVEMSATEVAANATDEVVISGIPEGAAVKVIGRGGGEGVADGEPLHLTFAQAGRYHVMATLFPYQDWKVSIHAN